MNLFNSIKKKIIKEFQVSTIDTGSSFVQIALLTESIKELANHLKIHKGDLHSKRGLIQKINKRKKLLKYLKKIDEIGYINLIQRLDLRK